MIIHGLGWPWVAAFDGFNTVNSIICFPPQLLLQPKLVVRKHPSKNEGVEKDKLSSP